MDLFTIYSGMEERRAERGREDDWFGFLEGKPGNRSLKLEEFSRSRFKYFEKQVQVFREAGSSIYNNKGGNTILKNLINRLILQKLLKFLLDNYLQL